MKDKANEMFYQLKGGKTLVIKRPEEHDAEGLISLIKTADEESPFLAREAGEFSVTIEKEKEIIANRANSDDSIWYIAVIDGIIVGQCSVGLVNRYKRYRHRAGVAMLVLKDYWNMGIGGKMMLECIDWCRRNDLEQLELEVVEKNINAIKMYESFGFKIIGRIENALKYADGTYVDEYIMMLKLK